MKSLINSFYSFSTFFWTAFCSLNTPRMTTFLVWWVPLYYLFWNQFHVYQRWLGRERGSVEYEQGYFWGSRHILFHGQLCNKGNMWWSAVASNLDIEYEGHFSHLCWDKVAMKAKVEVSFQLPGIVCVCHVILGLAQSMILGEEVTFASGETVDLIVVTWRIIWKSSSDGLPSDLCGASTNDFVSHFLSNSRTHAWRNLLSWLLAVQLAFSHACPFLPLAFLPSFHCTAPTLFRTLKGHRWYIHGIKVILFQKKI